MIHRRNITVLIGSREKRNLGKKLLCSSTGAQESSEKPGLEAPFPPSVGMVLQEVLEASLPFRKVAQNITAPRGGSLTKLREDAVCGDQALSFFSAPGDECQPS